MPTLAPVDTAPIDTTTNSTVITTTPTTVDDADLPPIEFEDDDGSEGCEWDFDLCYEEGTYSLAPYLSSETGEGDSYKLCLQHFTVWLEYIADVIGEDTSRIMFPDGEALATYVVSHVFGWAHPADAPFDAVPFPETNMRQYHINHVRVNEYRSERYGDDYPDVARHISYSTPVVNAMHKKIEEYFKIKGFTLVAKNHPVRDGEVNYEMVSMIIRRAIEPILWTAKSTDEALETIASCDIDTALARSDEEVDAEIAKLRKGKDEEETGSDGESASDGTGQDGESGSDGTGSERESGSIKFSDIDIAYGDEEIDF